MAQNGWFLLGKIPLKWMKIGGTPISGNPDICLFLPTAYPFLIFLAVASTDVLWQNHRAGWSVVVQQTAFGSWS